MAKRVKKQAASTRATEFNGMFVQENNYFTIRDGSYYSVGNKKELLNILKDKKSDLKDIIAKNKTDFKKDFEKALVLTVNYYDPWHIPGCRRRNFRGWPGWKCIRAYYRDQINNSTAISLTLY